MSKFAPRPKLDPAIASGILEYLREQNFSLMEDYENKRRPGQIQMAGRVATVLLEGGIAHVHLWEDRVVVAIATAEKPTKVIGDLALVLPDCFERMVNLLRGWRPPPCKPTKSRNSWITFPETRELSSSARKRWTATLKRSRTSFS